MSKKKVLLVLNTINDYRVETYNIINEYYDFTVGYNLSDQTKKVCKFKKIKFNTRKVGPFYVFGKRFWRECKKYDAVITSFDIHNFEFAFVPFIRRKYKLLTWSIGFRCSYTRPYDVNRELGLLDRLTYRIMQKADANIFYMEKAKEFWTRTNLDLSKVFIAPNTTSVCPIDSVNEKNSILFVGTLYKGKGVDKLIDAFHEATNGLNSEVTLDIVGKGEELDNLKALANEMNLGEKVIFHGAIYEETELAKLFSRAIICVSPTQAGLTVPKSMGYGVPVVTKCNAITGGEIYHIDSGTNGVIYDIDEQLKDIIKDAVSNPLKYMSMGEKAKTYYIHNASPLHQARSVIDALNFAFTPKFSL